jgi:hypothetical protein
MAALFAEWPGYPKGVATVAPLTGPTVSRTDLFVANGLGSAFQALDRQTRAHSAFPPPPPLMLLRQRGHC